MSASKNVGLSYDATPPIAAPFRFFLTAPFFGVAAGGILLFAGDAALSSRWMPVTLALTHLLSVGFMLLIMMGALIQVLPVVAGVSLPRPLALARVCHVALTVGALLLVWGLAETDFATLFWAGLSLGLGILGLVLPMLFLLLRQRMTQPVMRDLRFAGLGLLVTWALGAGVVVFLRHGWDAWRVLLDLHVAWAWLGWAGVLLVAMSWVVVPMFQITPSYPVFLVRTWVMGIVLSLGIWSGLVLASVPALRALGVVVLGALSYPLATLLLQQQSRRTKADTTFRGFQCGMVCFLAGSLAWLFSLMSDAPVWPLLTGSLILYGGFVGVIEAMLYKIVPFLVWLHLVQIGRKAPNMKKIWTDDALHAQFRSHLIALVLVVIAVFGGDFWVRLAGVAILIDFSLLWAGILAALLRYRAVKRTG